MVQAHGCCSRLISSRGDLPLGSTFDPEATQKPKSESARARRRRAERMAK